MVSGGFDGSVRGFLCEAAFTNSVFYISNVGQKCLKFFIYCFFGMATMLGKIGYTPQIYNHVHWCMPCINKGQAAKDMSDGSKQEINDWQTRLIVSSNYPETQAKCEY